MRGVRGRRSVAGMTRLPAVAPCIRPWRRTGTLSLVIALLAILLTGCGGGDAAATASPSRAAAGTATAQTSDAEPAVACPNPHGGQCLGRLEPGTYTTVSFAPAITYTVPAGWANGEDLPGNFQLQLNDDVRYLGIYKHANVPFKCEEHPDLRLSQTVSDYTRWLRRHPLLHVTTPVPVSIGGLRGVYMDISKAPGTRRQGVHLRGEHRQRAHHHRRPRPGQPAPRDH